LNASILGLSPSEVEERLDSIIEFADIGEFIDRPVRFYSSGMFARLAFSVAIHVDPDLLVVDEILAVGDEAFQRKCFARIEEIRSKGAAVLFVSHASSAILELCDRGLYMDAGEILFDGDAKDAVTHYHRVLYAPPKRAAELRDDLRLPEAADVDALAMPAPARNAAHDAEHDAEHDVTRQRTVRGATFDTDLMSQSTVVYEARGAQITVPRLLDESGQRVNCLQSGGRYAFVYDVRFDEACFDVRLHMLIKRISGVELGGGVDPPVAESGFAFDAGATRTMRFDFDCQLLHGVYFLNCGITGNGGQQLHRIVDALMFRVLPTAKATVFGVVNFGCSPRLLPSEDKQDPMP
jgi:lipopolysaccharide transport system ATP-binding protein